ncbi:MAG: UDP-N-acetylmuramoyl-L-alanine--D-glutamate ligase [Clostridiales bacterium]|nr:UDP-N-acetylmuramoyl-L-alanine--D-glutamate ligase [Clostridiales bacterium]
MTFDYKNVLIFGTGKSGIAAVGLLQTTKANIILYDSSTDVDEDKIKVKLGDNFRGEVVLGQLPDEIIKTIDLVVLSPGVPIDHDLVNKFRSLDTPIWGEVELAYFFEKGRVVAITGTNGKTTTTALVGEIFRAYFEKVFVVGNIGIPYTGSTLRTSEDSITIAEISSFQLETVHKFRPFISAILNLTPDHLDRHYTMENYARTKINITKNQSEDDICILNYDDELLISLSKDIKCRKFYFSSSNVLETGIYLDKDNIIYSSSKQKEIVCNVRDLKIIGKHNYENVMVACLIAIAANIPMETIRTVIKDFKGVEHRIEYVATKNNVKYYNDSKGTNPEASIKAIESMQSPTLLIAGGFDKGSTYDEWIKSFNGKVRYLVLLGQTKEKIAQAAMDNGFTNIILVDSLEEAVEACAENARVGDSVLLSPACASWGMFKDYEERGNLFKEYVNKL